MSDVSATSKTETKSNGEIIKEQKAQRENDAAYEAFVAEGKTKVTSLNASTADVLDFVWRSTENEQRTPAWDIALQEMLAERSRLLTLVSNIMRALADGATAVIKNIRA
jgi:hypothetical protein